MVLHLYLVCHPVVIILVVVVDLKLRQVIWTKKTIPLGDKGEYHTINESANQLQYQGSAEQQNDLEAIDAYYSEHPEDWEVDQ